MDAINSSSCTWTRFGHLVDDARKILKEFSNWLCKFTQREANEAAHQLVKAVIKDVINRIWSAQTLDCICDIVSMELVATSL